MAAGGELFIADTLDEPLAALAEKSLQDANAVIEFLDANPAPLIV